MTQVPPSSTPPTPKKPENSEISKDTPSGHGFQSKEMNFLGIHFNSKEATQLWQIISQSVSRQIQKDKEKALKSIRHFGKDQDDQGD